MEVLRVFGTAHLRRVFHDAEILSMRNVRGEGCSLTHEDFEFMLKELDYFPAQLVKFLLESVSGKCCVVAAKNTILKYVNACFVMIYLHIVILLQVLEL